MTKAYDLGAVETAELLEDYNTLRKSDGQEPIPSWERTKSELANLIYDLRDALEKRSKQSAKARGEKIEPNTKRGVKSVTCRSTTKGLEGYRVIVIGDAFGEHGAPLDPKGNPMVPSRGSKKDKQQAEAA